MRAWGITGLVAALLASHANAAEPFMPQTVTLTAAANKFEKWQKAIPCAAGSYSTTITLSKLNPGAPYESAAQILLRVPSGSGNAMFSIMTIHQKTPLYGRLDITGTKLHAPQISQYAPMPLQPGKKISVQLSWASRKEVRIVIDGHDQLSAPMTGAIGALEVTASGATAQFD